MIIGAIIEGTQYTGGGSQTNSVNGMAMLQFYNMNDAVSWAQSQSQAVTYGSTGQEIATVCTVINTDTDVKRWWFSGVEYTG